MNPEINRRQFTASVAASVAVASASTAAEPQQAAVGPLVGHVSQTTAKLWFRPATVGKFTVEAQHRGDAAKVQATATATAENDRCVTWELTELSPNTRYSYSIHSEDGVIAEGDDLYFNTAPASDAKVRLALGSCADRKPLPLWSQMEEQGAQGLVLLGDTPYIDSRNLAVAREKHRNFLAVPQLAKLIRHTPTWGTWDDHDFGANNSDGRMSGKEHTRRAFVEYRANAEFGDSDEGIYTKFRYGPVEVFLLDTRWFSRTEPSPVDPKKLTLLGKKQWDWLLDGLAKSTAPFKLITCGMIWDDKKNTESDDWGHYTHERTALFDYLGEKNISGAVLIGGDIHCSRWLKYKTEEQVGYPLHQFIVSPIHDRTIPSLNVEHPDLIKGEATPHVWLRLDVDPTKQPAELHAEWVQMDGKKMWDVTLTEDDLRRA